MIVPYIGVRKAKRKFPGLNGLSNSTGFRLRQHDQEITRTSEFKDASLVAESEKLAIALGWIGFFCIGLIIGGFLVFWLGQSSLLWKVLTLFFVAMVVFCQSTLWTGTAIRILRRKAREFHGCEHKVVMLLEAGLEPTRENLKRCPKINHRCGTSYATFYFNLLSGVIVFFILTIEASVATPEGNIVLDFLSLPWITFFVTFLFYFIFAPALFQHLFTLREPQDAIIEEGLEAAKKAYEALEASNAHSL